MIPQHDKSQDYQAEIEVVIRIPCRLGFKLGTDIPKIDAALTTAFASASIPYCALPRIDSTRMIWDAYAPTR